MSSLIVVTVLIFVLCVVLKVWLRSRKTDAERKGADGERKVAAEIARIGLDGMHDVYLRSARGTTQIDHIVKVGNAIVVIETKAWNGFIYGDVTEKKWRQSFRRRQSKSYLNPIVQNAGHVKAVRNIVGDVADVRSLVVMAGGATFPKGMPSGVVALSELATVMRMTLVDAGRVGSVILAWENLVDVVEGTNRRKAVKDHAETLDKTVPERRIALAQARKQEAEALKARKPGRMRIEDRVEPTF